MMPIELTSHSWLMHRNGIFGNLLQKFLKSLFKPSLHNMILMILIKCARQTVNKTLIPISYFGNIYRDPEEAKGLVLALMGKGYKTTTEHLSSFL